MNQNPHKLVAKDSAGKCQSCGRTAGCNCNASYFDWEEAKADRETTAWEAEQVVVDAWYEEIAQLEYEQFEDDAGTNEAFTNSLGMTDIPE